MRKEFKSENTILKINAVKVEKFYYIQFTQIMWTDFVYFLATIQFWYQKAMLCADPISQYMKLSFQQAICYLTFSVNTLHTWWTDWLIIQKHPFSPCLTFTHPYYKQVLWHLWCRWVKCSWLLACNVNVRLNTVCLLIWNR